MILSIDCGTQSIRAILFSLKGDIIDKEQIFYDPYFSKKAGWAEQKAEVYWDGLCEATNILKSSLNILLPLAISCKRFGFSIKRSSVILKNIKRSIIF